MSIKSSNRVNNAKDTSPARLEKSTLSTKAQELLGERQGSLPVWIRAPKTGNEYHSGFSRAKLYQLATDRRIRTASIREPGKLRGTRLFHMQSILDYIAKCEAEGDSTVN